MFEIQDGASDMTDILKCVTSFWNFAKTSSLTRNCHLSKEFFKAILHMIWDYEFD